MKLMLKAPAIKRLKLKHDRLQSSFAFNFNLRRYIKVGNVRSSGRNAGTSKMYVYTDGDGGSDEEDEDADFAAAVAASIAVAAPAPVPAAAGPVPAVVVPTAAQAPPVLPGDASQHNLHVNAPGDDAQAEGEWTPLERKIFMASLAKCPGGKPDYECGTFSVSIPGRGFHSSTLQLNLSRYVHCQTDDNQRIP